MNGLAEESEKWFDNLLTYCALARENTSEESLEEEGCLARERFMAERIREYAGRKAGTEEIVLVVTGGFHTPGLRTLLGGQTDGAVKMACGMAGGNADSDSVIAESRSSGQEKSRKAGKKSGKEGRKEANSPSGRVPAKDQGVYLMPYSMEAADALNGYASGMPFPGFYQKIWAGIPESDTPYKDAVLDLIVSSGKETRRKEGYLSTYDEICACSMADGLAGLRGKREQIGRAHV